MERKNAPKVAPDPTVSPAGRDAPPSDQDPEVDQAVPGVPPPAGPVDPRAPEPSGKGRISAADGLYWFG